MTEVIASRTDIRWNEAQIEEIRRLLRQRGIFLKLSRNFQLLADLIEETPTRAKLHEQFDPHTDMDGAKDAFWVGGFDQDGNLLHTQAAHLLELKGKTLADHLAGNLSNYFPKSPAVERSSIVARPGPSSRSITGMVAYHGEMWVSPELRDRLISSMLIRLGLFLIEREWSADAVFGLMNYELALRGLGMRVGYTKSEPMTLTWDRMDADQKHYVWLVYLKRPDIKFLLDLPTTEILTSLSQIEYSP